MTRRAALFVAGAVAVAVAVLAVMWFAGGDDYGPPDARDPCTAGTGGKLPANIEAVAERVVLLGTDEAACKLGVTRERLLLSLASADSRAQLADEVGVDEAELAAELKTGLDRGVTRLAKTGDLPKVSAFKSEVLEEADLPESLRPVIEATPDVLIDSLLPTEGVLHRAVGNIDAQRVIKSLDDPDSLEPQLREAIQDAAIAEAREQLVSKLPGPIGDLFD